tara:strand:+ start:180 stop:368 length:189 start_codon:yes stop_codon:yes gene_type:complete
VNYKIKDKNGRDYEIKDIKKFAKHIFEFHSTGSSLHQEQGHDFIVDDAFREKIAIFIKKEKK